MKHKQEIIQQYHKGDNSTNNNSNNHISNTSNSISNSISDISVVVDFCASHATPVSLDIPRLNHLSLLLSETPERINMNPVNFNFLEKNFMLESELRHKISQLEKDRVEILNRIAELNAAQLTENTAAFNHINKHLQRMITYFIPNMSISINQQTHTISVYSNTKEAGIKDNKDNISDKGTSGNISSSYASYSLSELSGGQRSIVAMCLMFASLTYRPAPFYIFDEIDSALDLNHTQHIGEIIQHEFTTAQFIVVSLKNNMYENANRIYQVYIEDKKSRIKTVK